MIGFGERALWEDFPAVIRNDDPTKIKNDPDYIAGKAGDAQSALSLVQRFLTDKTVERVGILTRDICPKLLPVLAVEASGRNKIPLAIATVLAHKLNLDVELGIVQRERIARTGSHSDHRLVCNPTFDGFVTAGESYFIVDDAFTMGGTIASLRGYVENRGAHVVGAAVMIARPNPLDLKVSPEMLHRIYDKHGSKMNELAKEFTGHGLEYFTQQEAGHFRAAESVDSMRARLVAARDAAFGRLDETGVGTPNWQETIGQPLIIQQVRSTIKPSFA